MGVLKNTGRFATLMCSVVVVGFAGDATLSLPQAQAQDVGAEGVNFADPTLPLQAEPAPSATIENNRTARFAQISPIADAAPTGETEAPRAYEIELSAPRLFTGMPVDVSIAQRASLGADRGDIYRRGSGSEVRVGRALGEANRTGGEDPSQGRIYMFAASDDEAVTWQPGGETSRGFSMQQDRVEIGDMMAGVTYERNGVQASLAYVEREVSTQIGIENISQDENFAGLTLTMRR